MLEINRTHLLRASEILYSRQSAQFLHRVGDIHKVAILGRVSCSLPGSLVYLPSFGR